MKIEILGTGCPKCQALVANVEAAVRNLGIEAEVTKVEDIMEITSRGVMFTPALAIDGEIKASGKVLSPEQIRDLIG